ncbi:MAG: class I SAM-dependent methyltransferase [Bdellovibrionales bacterium]|nr:class I SAM-dependent methyltransferase [Bdellovibrionales bacterium]
MSQKSSKKFKDRTFLVLSSRIESPKPKFERYDIQLPESLIRHFIENYTKKGDRVLDPFAGLGSTIRVSEQLGRVPFGVEPDARRHAWICKHTSYPGNVILGDSGKITKFGLPKFDLCFTSPPYMPRYHRWNPLYKGDPKYSGYKNYQKRLKQIFNSVSQLMKRGAPVVIQVDNLKDKRVSPLAWDIAETVSAVFKFEGEIIVGWEGSNNSYYDHTYCLVFKKI